MTPRLVISDNEIQHYEGLVRKTASMYAGIVEEEYEDICSLLRIKVWQALLAFDPEKARQSKDKYVFMCVKNRVKDLIKKVRRNDIYIEDVAPSDGTHMRENVGGQINGQRDRFEARYLVALEEQVFGDIDKPLIPSTLTGQERTVLAYLYLDYPQAEIAEVMEVGRKEVATSVRGIRSKMEDWRPTPEDGAVEDQVPLAA